MQHVTDCHVDPIANEAPVADLIHAVAGAGRGTHHRYLAVPVRARW